MRCKDIERLIIDSSEETSAEELSAVREHVEHCARCAQLQDDLRKIRVHLKGMRRPVPAEELLKRTQSMCHDKMSSLHRAKAIISAKNHLRLIPKYIWVALALLIILTGIFMLWLLKDFRLSLPLSLQTAIVLMLMIQNAGMLFFAPLLMRRFRSNHQSLRLGSTG